ncbi:hypothetical protein [Peribacillus acanthi]|uniref:hypothetical protein n=1 Tax=Peribacillus acanthi TaxID=2171554 RepID=UPI001F0C5FBE|nr:hypothetical protein [Peribacillus acanthi]
MIIAHYYGSSMYMINGGNDKETRKLWDAMFTLGLLSLLKDSHDSQIDDKKFKQLLLQIIIGIIFAAILFSIGFLILD